MSVFFTEKDSTRRSPHIDKESIQRVRKEIRRQQVVTYILFIIFLFQLVSLPGTIIMQSALNIGTVILGILLCGVAMMFNRMGKVGIVSILLILVVDLGCGLMLLTPDMTMSSIRKYVFGRHYAYRYMLWKVGNAVNLLLTRLRRARQIGQENKQLRSHLLQVRERFHEATFMHLRQEKTSATRQKNDYSTPGF
jgi:hypothetical protein